MQSTAYVGYDLGDGESVIDFAVLSAEDLKKGSGVTFPKLTMPDTNDEGAAIPTVFGCMADGTPVFASMIRDDPESVKDIYMNFKRKPSDIIGPISDARFHELISMLEKGWPSQDKAPELHTDEMKRFAYCTQTFTALLFSDKNIKDVVEQASSVCRNVVISVGHPTKWNDLDIAVYRAIFRNTPIGSSQYAGMNASLTLERESRAAFLFLKNIKYMTAIRENESVLIIDTGSSTIDLTAVTSDSRSIQYNSGSNYLGARGIDFLIMDWYLEKICADDNNRKMYESTVAHNPSINRAVLLTCREAKEYIYSHASGKRKVDCADFPSEKLSADDIRYLAENKPLAPVLSKYLKLLDKGTQDSGKSWLSSLYGLFSQGKAGSNNPALHGMGNKSWMTLLREFFAQEKYDMTQKGIKAARIIITGSASKMPFVKDIISEVFTGSEIISDVDPSRSISMGLTLAGPFDAKSKAFRDEVEAFIRDELPEIVRADMPVLAGQIAPIIEGIVMNTVSRRFSQWQKCEITTLDGMMGTVKGDLDENSLNAELTGNADYNNAVDKWLSDTVGHDIAVRLKEICSRYGMTDINLEALNFLKVSAGGITVDGITLDPGKDILETLSTIIGIVGGIIAAIVTPFIIGAIIGIISWVSVTIAANLLVLLMAIPGPGWWIIIGIAGIAAFNAIKSGLDGAKEAVQGKLLSADLPQWVRNRFSLSTIQSKFSEKDISGQIRSSMLSPESLDKIVQSIAGKLGEIVKKRAEDLRYVLESR